MKASSRLALLLCLAGLLAAAAQDTRLPNDPGKREPEEEVQPPQQDHDESKSLLGKKTCDEDALMIDVQIIASKNNWDMDATRQHMLNQKAFATLVHTVATNEAFSGRFAGSAMAKTPGEEATIWFKGSLAEKQLDQRLKTLIANAEDIQGMRVRFVDGMRFSEEEQEARAAAIIEHHLVTDAKSGEKTNPGINVAIRPGDVMLVTMPAGEGLPKSDSRRETPCLGTGGDSVDAVLLNRDLIPKLLPEAMHGDVRGILFEFTEGNEDQDQHARGGRKVYGGGYQCTSGFSVYRISDGLNGITTAGHCTGMSTFDAESPEADFALYHRAEHCGSHGDMEWKSTSHVELAEYWASPWDRRDVRSVESWYSVNNWYCLYSRMTGTRICDQVYSTSTSQTGCQGRTAYRLVAMDDNSGIGGDSGGPWSWGTEAAGIVKGYKTIWFNKRSTFTKATRFDNGLGVWIKTK